MKKYKNKKWLYQKYIIQKRSTYEIAKIIKCSYETIRRWLKIYNIKIRTIFEIRAKYKTGKYTQEQLVIKYNVTQTTISNIINRKIWRHI